MKIIELEDFLDQNHSDLDRSKREKIIKVFEQCADGETKLDRSCIIDACKAIRFGKDKCITPDKSAVIEKELLAKIK